MTTNSEEQQIVMYGATWCRDCIRTKKYFEENGVSYQWVNIEENPEAVEIVVKINNGMRSVPTIMFPDGSVLVEPSNKALAEKLALQQA